MPQAVAAAAAWIGNAIGTAIGTTLTAIGVPASVALPATLTVAAAAYQVSQIAIIAGLQYAIDDISRQKAAPFGAELQLRVDPDMAREMIIGERLTAGSLVARYSRGSNLYNAHFVYQLADHPCVELSKVYGDGRLVQSSPLAHGTRTEITAYSYSGGARVWMTWHDGRPGQTYDSDLVTKSAQDPDVIAGQIQGWTSAHVGAGCAYVHIEVQYDSDILTSIPQFLFHVKGAKLYDRRKDTTAGGSGAHRIDDPSTWEYSTNAAVATDHYMLGYQVEGDALAFGIGLSKTEVPYDTFAAAADLADEDVLTGEAPNEETIKRYAANGIISTADFFEDVLETFQTQMAARIVDLGGRIGILGAEERTSVVSLTDDDWASDESVRFADKLPFSDLFGAVSGSFPDPANLYQATPYERQTTAYLALPDGGEATTAQLDLPFETHPRRAVRLASAWIKRESLQPRLVGTFATRSLAWKLEPGDWFDLTSARLQVTAALFEVIDIVKNDDFSVTMTARAIDPDFLAFGVDEDPDLSVPPAVDPYALVLDEPTFDLAASSVSASGAVYPAIEFTLTSNETNAREVVVEYGVWDGADILGPTHVDTFHIDQVVTKLTKGVLPSTDYKVRAKVKGGARESAWTAWSSPVTIAAAFAAGTAAEVPWSGVLDDDGHRPENDADVTITHTAAAITGQGTFATLSSISSALADANNLLRRTAGGLFTGELNADLTSGHTAAAISGQGGLATLSFVTIGTNLRRADGTTVATESLIVTALGVASAISGQGALATLNQVNFGASGVVYREDGSTHVTDALVVTASGTAAAISGQGSLATLNFVQFNSNVRLQDGSTVVTDAIVVTASGTAAAISGQGGLATLNYVHFSSNVRLADGTTVVTDAIVVTASGTAAAISGQGNQATSNSYYQASDPGGNNGDWWYDTTNAILKYKASGTWQSIANFNTQITASASPSSVNVAHTGSSFTSGTITITPSGGTSYTYSVTFNKSGGAGNVSLSATNSNSFTATASLSSGQDVAGGIIVQVFDTSGASCTIRIPLNFTRTD